MAMLVDAKNKRAAKNHGGFPKCLRHEAKANANSSSVAIPWLPDGPRSPFGTGQGLRKRTSSRLSGGERLRSMR
jgi:hypothetical protein